VHQVSPCSALAFHYRLHISCPLLGKPPKLVQTARSPRDKGTGRQTDRQTDRRQIDRQKDEGEALLLLFFRQD